MVHSMEDVGREVYHLRESVQWHQDRSGTSQRRVAYSHDYESPVMLC